MKPVQQRLRPGLAEAWEIVNPTTTRFKLRQGVKFHNGEVFDANSVKFSIERLVAEWKPDLLLSDITMPDEDGYTVIGRLRSLPPERGGATPAAALTAMASDQDRARALAAGFQLHIPKPLEPGILLLAVAELARRGAGPEASAKFGR